MFGDLLGDMQKHQDEMKKVLSEMKLSVQNNDETLTVECNALREIKNISISEELFNSSSKEQLEDELVVLLNKALTQAATKEAIEAQKLLQNAMPPGLGGLGDLFK